MPPARQPSAASTTSTLSIPTPLRHPTLDTHSPHRTLSSRHVSRLEQSAEDMSQGGSDIGEEIRKMNEAEKRVSRQNSIQSSHHGEISVVRPNVHDRLGSQRSRASSSQANSIRDVNTAARWGGYSPGGFVTSPVGSVSRSWSHASGNNNGARDVSKSSRRAPVNEPLEEGKQLGSPLAADAVNDGLPSRDPSQSSFAKRYDAIAGQIEDQLDEIAASSPRVGPEPEHKMDISGHEHLGADGGIDRRPSTDTYREAQYAFRDFDGAHYNPHTEEIVELDEEGNEVRRVSARNSSGALSLEAASLLRTTQPYQTNYVEPPPDQDMVYYPAPVPRMINLPKRLSNLPAANKHAHARAHMLGELPPDARASAPWLSQADLSSLPRSRGSAALSQGSGQGEQRPPATPNNNRHSVANLSQLPPQLRASVYFDQSQSIPQDIEITGDSAVATLDNILQASATAPATAFTDHPYAGDVSKTVYSHSPGTARKSTTTVATHSSPGEKRKKRRSSIGDFFKRATSSDGLSNTLRKKSSRGSGLTDLEFNEGGKKLQKRKSQLSLGGELERPAEDPGDGNRRSRAQSVLIANAHNATPQHDGQDNRPGSTPMTSGSGEPLNCAEYENEEDIGPIHGPEQAEDGEASFVQPSTLLAELQVRKVAQDSRNRTAVTAYPQGMYSTLLELDAVDEVMRRKRKQSRTALAWEDPAYNGGAEKDESDDDVPLGVLFPSKNGLINRATGDARDWERPLGLMERREMEDTEPLSHRRDRLRGVPPRAPRRPVTSVMPTASQLHLAGQPDAPVGDDAAAPADDHEDETLAQRRRRMKTKSMLDTTIADFAPAESGDPSRPVSTFTDDLLAQFGGLDVQPASQPSHPDPPPPPPKNPARNRTPAPAPAPTPSPGPDGEEETLGQRRARLQRARDTSNPSHHSADPSTDPSDPPPTTPKPALTSRNSLANLLATNPVGLSHPTRAPGHQPLPREPAPGSLLHSSGLLQARQKRELGRTNLRGSSAGMPMVGVAGTDGVFASPTAGLAMGQQGGLNVGAYGALHGVTYGEGAYGAGFAPAPGAAYGYGYGYGMSPGVAGNPAVGGMGMGTGMGMGMGMPQQGMGNYYPYANGPASGMRMGAGAGAGAGVGLGLGVFDEGLDRGRRDAIDRWRMSVAQ